MPRWPARRPSSNRDDPKTGEGVTRFLAGAGPQFRIPAERCRRMFRLDPEKFRGDVGVFPMRMSHSPRSMRWMICVNVFELMPSAAISS